MDYQQLIARLREAAAGNGTSILEDRELCRAFHKMAPHPVLVALGFWGISPRIAQSMIHVLDAPAAIPELAFIPWPAVDAPWREHADCAAAILRNPAVQRDIVHANGYLRQYLVAVASGDFPLSSVRGLAKTEYVDVCAQAAVATEIRRLEEEIAERQNQLAKLQGTP